MRGDTAISSRRMAIAAFVAPMAASLVVASFLAGWGMFDPGPISIRAFLFSLGIILLYGMPFAYLAAAVVGIPGFYLLRARGWLDRDGIIRTAGGTGAIVMPIVGDALHTVQEFGLFAVLGAIAGGLAGYCFWRIGLAVKRA